VAKITSTEYLDGYNDGKNDNGYHRPHDYGVVSDFVFKTDKEARENDEYTRGYREGKKNK